MSDTLFKWIKASDESPAKAGDYFIMSSDGNDWQEDLMYFDGEKWTPNFSQFKCESWLKEIKQPPTNINKEVELHNFAMYIRGKVLEGHTTNGQLQFWTKQYLQSILLNEGEEIKQPIEEDNLLKAIKNEYADYKRIAELHMNENDAEIERLEKQLGEVTAGAAMNEQSLLELNRKIKENTIDKAIEWLEKEKFDIPESDFEKTYNSTLHKAINYLESLK